MPDDPPPLQAMEASKRTTVNPKAAVTGRRRTTAAVNTVKIAISHRSHALLKCRSGANGSILIPEFGGAMVRSEVETVNVAAVVGEVVGVTGLGAIEQVIVAGAMQFSATGWENPEIEVTLIAYWADFPAGTAGVEVNEEMVNGGTRTPVPVAKMT